MNIKYKLVPYSALALSLTACAKDQVNDVVSAGETAATFSGGNIVKGILIFVVMLVVLGASSS